VVARLNKEINTILALPDVKARFATIGMEPVGGSPAQFAQFIQDDLSKWSELVKVRNIKAD
jgi:tripartite-type tricarboxylate transporter receptor subunit TctC